MKKIFCKLLSVILTLIISSQFFMPQSAYAVKVSEIIYDFAYVPTPDCFSAIKILDYYLKQKSVPSFNKETDEKYWNENEIEIRSKALSLIFYIIIYFNWNRRISTDITFTSLYQPKISLRDYIKRLLIYAPPGGDTKCLLASLITTLLALDELQHRNFHTCECELVVKYLNIHRLFATSYLVSMGFCEDDYYSMKYIAEVFGFPERDVRKFQIYFLMKIGFNLWFSSDKFILYENLFESISKKIPYIEWDYDCQDMQ